MKKASLLRNLIVISLTVFVCSVLVAKVDVGVVREIIFDLSPGVWAAAFVICAIVLLSTVLRWQLILRQVGVEENFKKCLTIILGVWPLTVISPSKAGDVFRVAGLRRTHQKSIILGTVFFERVVDLLVLFSLALIGGILQSMNSVVVVSVLSLVAIIVTLFLTNTGHKLPLPENVSEKVENALLAFKKASVAPVVFMLSIVYTLIKWIAAFVLIKILYADMGVAVDLLFVFTMFPIVILVGLLPFTLSGIGVRDGALIVLFSSIATEPQSLAVGVMYTFFVYILFGIIGLFFTRQALDV